MNPVLSSGPNHSWLRSFFINHPENGFDDSAKKGRSVNDYLKRYNALPFHFKPLRTPWARKGREFRDVQISRDFTPSIRDNRRVSGRRFFSGRSGSIWQGGQKS